MTTITSAEFQANMHFYLERVFRDNEMIKVKDGARSFVLLGEAWPATQSDNIALYAELSSSRRNPLVHPPRSHLSRPVSALATSR